MKVLLLDSDRTSVRTLQPAPNGLEISSAHAQTEGLRLLREGCWDLVLLDEDFSGAGVELLARVSSQPSAPPVALLSSRPSMETTLRAIDAGAIDVLSKPPSREKLDEIVATLRKTRKLRPLPPPPGHDRTIVGNSPGMLGVFKSIARAATSNATVLILGESGTGKEMAARVLHARSRRAARPFVTINCAAIPENLLESELFGHEKGSFTGAIGRRVGRFERADGGTLFLDEIGDMSTALQAKILRALQEREVERVGGDDLIPVDVRIIAATNRDLGVAVREGTFREDLYYRLAVVSVRLPPLRDRGKDLELLTEHFAARYAHEHERPIRALAEGVIETLYRRSWPGNVRQLRNVIERAVVMAEGDVLLPENLPSEQGYHLADDDEFYGPLCTLAEMEKKMILRALRESGSSHTEAAEILGLHRNTIRRKLKEFGLSVKGESRA